MSVDTSAARPYHSSGMAKRPALPTLSGVLQQEIVDCGAPMRQIARVSGVDHAVLSRFVNGHRTITLDTADRLAGQLGFVLKRVKGA